MLSLSVFLCRLPPTDFSLVFSGVIVHYVLTPSIPFVRYIAVLRVCQGYTFDWHRFFAS